MNCQHVRELLPLYVDGELEGADLEHVAQHIAACAECRRRAEVDRQLTVALGELPPDPAAAAMAPSLRRRVMAEVGRQRRWQPVRRAVGTLAHAATATAVVAIAAVLVVAIILTGRPLLERRLQVAGPALPGRVIASEEPLYVPYYTGDGERVDRTPQLSSDGSRLAYMLPAGEGAAALDRIVIRDLAAGRGYEVVAEAGYSYASIRWSPDSKVLAFVKYQVVEGQATSSELWRVDADGSNLKLLYRPLPEPAALRGPSIWVVRWTGDGRYVEVGPKIWSGGGPNHRIRADGGGEQTQVAPVAAQFGAAEDALQGEPVTAPRDDYQLVVAKTAGLKRQPQGAAAGGTSLVLYDVRSRRSRVLGSFAGQAYISSQSVSPDGSWIVVDVVDQPGAQPVTWAVHRDGSALHQIQGGAQGLVQAGRPLWSGSGRVYFNVPPRHDSGNVPGSLYELDLATGKVGLVTNEWPEQSIVSISADGGRIVVARDEGDGAELYLLTLVPRVEGEPTVAPQPTMAPKPVFGPARDLLALPASIGPDYRISPDGRWVAYMRYDETVNGQALPWRLVEQSLETGETRTLLEDPPAEASVLAWIGNQDPRRGHLVLIQPGNEQAGALEVLDAAARTPLVLAQPEGDVEGFTEAVLSPDGQRVAFTVLHVAPQAPVPRIGIEVVGLDGSGRRQIVEPDFFVGQLAWTPDGKQIYYFKGKGGTPPDDGEAYAMNVDGSGEPQLLLPRVRLAAWSPDGTQALWLGQPSDGQGRGDLWLTGVSWPTTADYLPIVKGASASGATFAGSSRWVAYGKDNAIYLMEVGLGAGGQPERLTPEGEMADAPVWAPGMGLIYRVFRPDAPAPVLRLLPLAQGGEGSEQATMGLTVEEHAVADQATGFPTDTEGTGWMGEEALGRRRPWREPSGAERVAASNEALGRFGYRLEPKQVEGYGHPFYDLYQGDRVVLADLSYVWPVSVRGDGQDFALLVSQERGPYLLVRRSGSEAWDITQQPPVFVGQDLVTVGHGAALSDVVVRRGSRVVYSTAVQAGPTSDPVKGLWSWDGHWVLEVAGKVIVDGQELNSQLGYDEIFGWRLLHGKPFYLFRQGDRIGVSYGGAVLPQRYEQVPHYQCCSAAAYNPGGNDDMAWFFGLRGGKWYYVEMGVYGAEAPAVQPTAAPSAAQPLQAVATWQGATGSLAGRILFTNLGSTPITLQGRPQVAIVDAKGQELPTVMGEWRDPNGAPDPVVVLQPGQQAQALLIWANYCGPAPAAPLTLHITLPDGERLVAPVLDAAGNPLGDTPRCNTDAPASALTVGVFQTVQEGATPVPFPSTSVDDMSVVTWLHMVDANTGWATTGHAVLRTADGGRTWQDVTPTGGVSIVSGAVSYGLAGLGAYDAEHAWLVYGSDPQTPMMVMRTADGGRTWQQALVPVGGTGGSFSWPDASHGWLLVNQGAGAGNEYVAVARTGDGGASWWLASSGDAPGGIPSAGIKSGIAARDATTAWVTGFAPVDGKVYLYTTRDGGVTWQEQRVPLPAGFERAQAASQSPVFAGAQHGAFAASLAGDKAALVIYGTSDGGATWLPSSPLAPGGMASFTVAVASPDEAWAVAASGEQGEGQLYHTQDGGESWEAVGPAPAGVWFLQFRGRSGWALAAGALLRTDDGGKTWVQVK